MSSCFECKYDHEKCDKCIGCRCCGSCIYFDDDYCDNDYNCCNWCDDNPYNDDRIN